MTRDDTVEAANTRFYRAVTALDLALMEACWLREDYISCLHPGGTALFGWRAIMDGWERIFSGLFGVEIVVTLQSVHLAGPVAWSLVTQENVASTYDGRTTAVTQSTNIFERRNGLWQLAHHHGSAVARPAAASDRAWQ